MRQHCQLAALQFNDIEGYAAGMQLHEEQALALKDRYRQALHPVHAPYPGRIVPHGGDSMLRIFYRAAEAEKSVLAT
ncbi:hypothetical protein OB13_16150 [Pontibacter sp. HJ8]